MELIKNKKFQLTFITTFITALLAHGIAMFNKFSYHDDLSSIFGHDVEYSGIVLGRWGLEIIERFFRWFHGGENFSVTEYWAVLAFIATAFMSFYMIKLFKIEDNFTIIFISALQVAFPRMASLFGYAYDLFYYQIAFLCVTLSVYYLFEKDLKAKYGFKWIILSLLLTAFGIGIYQAVIPFWLTLIIIRLMIDVKNEEFSDWKSFWKKSIFFLIYSVLSFILYYVILRIFLLAMHTEVNDYQGLGDAANTSVLTYISRLKYAYGMLFKLHYQNNRDVFPGGVRRIYYIALFLSFIFTLILWIRAIRAKKKRPAFQFLILFIILPIAYNFIYIMSSPSTDIHALMLGSYELIFIYFILSAKYFFDEMKGNTKYLYYFANILAAIVVVLYIRYDNACYTKMIFLQSEATSWFSTLRTRVESTPGFDQEMQVCFLNDDDKSVWATNYYMERFKEISINPYNEDTLINDYNWERYMRFWTGYYPQVFKGDKDEMAKKAKEEGLTKYPADGSIKVIDGVVVVNF